jgi:lysophospholipase L1-like esterase
MKKNLKIWFPIVSVLIFFSIFETVFRFVIIHDDTGNSLAGFTEADPDLIWRLKPRLDGIMKTNQLGFRDTTYKDYADYKILLLGDSISWGDGVRMEQSYPFLLERRLSRDYPRKIVEVINTGVPGYSTFQQLIYLKKRGIKLKPNIIIHQFCLNDIVERYSTLFQYGGDNIFLGIDTRSSIAGLNGFMVKHSRAYEWILRYLINFKRKKQEYAVIKLTREKLSLELEEAWQLVLNEINQIVQIAEQENIPYLLVVAPYLFQLKNPFDINQPQVRLQQFSLKRNFKLFDLLDDFYSQHQLSEKKLFNDENHFSETGHMLAAALLSDQVRKIINSLSQKKFLQTN